MERTGDSIEARPVLPAQKVYSSLPRYTRSAVLVFLRMHIGKSKVTFIRWFYGVVYPRTLVERNAVAKVLGKLAGCKLSGDELFPADYPYRGANMK